MFLIYSKKKMCVCKRCLLIYVTEGEYSRAHQNSATALV